MRQFTTQKHAGKHASKQQIPISGLSFEGEADGLIREVLTLESSPSAEADQTTSYDGALADFMAAKEAQAERIENRLEALQQAQQATVQQLESSRPGMLSLPGTRRKWDAQVRTEQRRLNQLAARLSVVKEAKGHIDAQGGGIAALAAARLRRDRPALAAEWDEQQAAARRDEAEQRESRKRDVGTRRIHGQAQRLKYGQPSEN